ncbi:MAG TPA: FG-GAP repeat protein [Thermoleophilaceae bacterium]
MKRLSVPIALFVALIFASAAHAADPFAQQAELTARDGAPTQILGTSVAISGDTMVVAAPMHSGPQTQRGAAYVFQRTASGWADATQVAVLTLSDGQGGRIGPVAISGDTIAVGVDDQKVGAHAGQGAVYVFVKPPSGWSDAHETAELTASDGQANDQLGASVAISGDTIAAGAPSAQAGKAGHEGQAYVFVKPSGGWKDGTQTARPFASDGTPGSRFSASIAISGDVLVVGAPDHTVGQSQLQGSAYVFVKPGAGWIDAIESAQLTASGGAAGDRFGRSVAIAGDTVAIGAPNRQSSKGAAYVFVKPPAGWTGNPAQAAELTASGGEKLDAFGVSVAVSGDTVVAGSSQEGMDAVPKPGLAYVFVKPGATWADSTQAQELRPADSASSDGFGDSVAMDGNVAVVGAPARKVGTNELQGAAYVFGVPPSIAIARPSAGEVFTQGQVVTASYACTAAAGATIASCNGPVAAGAPIDTRTLGTHAFAVGAIDSGGVSATRSVSYTVVQARLSISALRQSASVWRRGTTFSFRLNKPARLALRFRRRAAAAGTLTLKGHAGLNRARFHGRLSPKKRLRPGHYSLRITATSGSGERSTSRLLKFTIVR